MRAREADRCSRAAKVLLFHHPDNDALPRTTEIMDETTISAALASAGSTWGDVIALAARRQQLSAGLAESAHRPPATAASP